MHITKFFGDLLVDTWLWVLVNNLTSESSLWLIGGTWAEDIGCCSWWMGLCLDLFLINWLLVYLLGCRLTHLLINDLLLLWLLIPLWICIRNIRLNLFLHTLWIIISEHDLLCLLSLNGRIIFLLVHHPSQFLMCWLLLLLLIHLSIIRLLCVVLVIVRIILLIIVLLGLFPF